MLVNVTYDNPNTEEHEEYKSSLVEVLEAFGWDKNQFFAYTLWVEQELKKQGEAVIKNGFATTTITKGTEENPGDQANPAVMCNFCQRIDTPIGGDYIMTVSANECRWIDRENHDNEDYAVYWEVYSALGDECVCGGDILECSDDKCCWGQYDQVCHRPMMERLLKALTEESK